MKEVCQRLHQKKVVLLKGCYDCFEIKRKVKLILMYVVYQNVVDYHFKLFTVVF